MEEKETAPALTRKELRRLKLAEYLSGKGKLKLKSSESLHRDGSHADKCLTSALQGVNGKENKPPDGCWRASNGKEACKPGQNPTNANARLKTTGGGTGARATGTRERALFALHLRQGSTRTNARPVESRSNVTGLLRTTSNASAQAPAAARPAADRKTIGGSTRRPTAPMTFAARISLGPVVKTRTGLIPAVIQPRDTRAPAVATSRVSSSVPATRRTLPPAALKNPARGRPVSSQVDTRGQSKPKVPPARIPPPASRPSGRLTSTVAAPAPACRPAPAKVAAKWVPPPAQKPPRQKPPPVTLEKRVPPCKVTTSGPKSGHSLRPPAKGVSSAAAIAPKPKPVTCAVAGGKTARISVKVAPTQATAKTSGAPLHPQKVPRPAGVAPEAGRTSAPSRPHTAGTKAPATQEERMRKLQEWREAKGIAYKRPPMPAKPRVRRTVAAPESFWRTMKEEEEAQSFISAVDRSLADCIKLLGEGCPPSQVGDIVSRLPPVARRFAKFWICKARLMEREGNLDVLPLFEEAVGAVLEPVDELRTVVFDILKKKDDVSASDGDEVRTPGGEGGDAPGGEGAQSAATPEPVRALICGEAGTSSVVKFKVTATPGGPSAKKMEPTRVNGQEVRFFTPVRRSVRIEASSLRYPASLQEHDLCVASYRDLMATKEEEEEEEEKGGAESDPPAVDNTMYVYRQNDALADKVCIQLFCDNATPASETASAPPDE